jgi:hypothetical protein
LSPTHPTLLPSFAAFQESADRDDRQKLAPEIAVKPESSTCRGCVEKKRFIDDIALAINSLDEMIHRLGSQTMKKVDLLNVQIGPVFDSCNRDLKDLETALRELQYGYWIVCKTPGRLYGAFRRHILLLLMVTAT